MIKKVENNKAKANTFKNLIDRYKNAFKNGFYLECLVLIYAMLEDRFNEILIHLNIAEYSDKGLAIKDTYQQVIHDILGYKSTNQTVITISTISAKYKIIKYLSNEKKQCDTILVNQHNALINADQNAKKRKNGMESTKINPLISQIEKWTKSRDQYIHALFNKDFDDAIANLPELSEKGLNLARELNNFSDRVETQMK